MAKGEFKKGSGKAYLRSGPTKAALRLRARRAFKRGEALRKVYQRRGYQ